MLKFLEFTEEAGRAGRFVNTLFEEPVFHLIGVLQRISGPLEHAGIVHEVVGGLAVFVHVERANSEYGRTTKDVDIMIHRTDLARVIEIAGKHGFNFRHAAGVDMLQYGDTGKAKDAVHLLFSGETVKANSAHNPVLAPEKVHFRGGEIWVIQVSDLVRMKLNTNRLVDKLHVKDMDEVGLITSDIELGLSVELKSRLAAIRASE